MLDSLGRLGTLAENKEHQLESALGRGAFAYQDGLNYAIKRTPLALRKLLDPEEDLLFYDDQILPEPLFLRLFERNLLAAEQASQDLRTIERNFRRQTDFTIALTDFLNQGSNLELAQNLYTDFLKRPAKDWSDDTLFLNDEGEAINSWLEYLLGPDDDVRRRYLAAFYDEFEFARDEDLVPNIRKLSGQDQERVNPAIELLKTFLTLKTQGKTTITARDLALAAKQQINLSRVLDEDVSEKLKRYRKFFDISYRDFKNKISDQQIKNLMSFVI